MPKSDWEQQLDEMPENIRAVAEKYPPGKYRMTKDAPYALSCPDTIVILYSYAPDGNITVVITPDEMRPEALEHEKQLLIKHNRIHLWDQIKNSPKSAEVEPKYLELIEDFTKEDNNG